MESDFTLERRQVLARLRNGNEARLSQAASLELESLQTESDSQLFYESLLNFGIRQEQSGHLDIAAEVYTTLVGAARERPLRITAQQQLDAIMGRGAFGPRAEFLLRNLAQQASEPTALLAMGAAGTVFRVTRLATLSRLASASNPGFLTRMLGAGRVASLAGFAAEAPTFTLVGRLGSEALGRSQDWSGRALGRDFASSYMVLGGLKLAGWAGTAAYRNVAGPTAALHPAPLQTLFQQGAMFSGILLGHGLERWAGLRPHQAGDTTLTDSLALLLQFHVAGRLNRHLMGSRFAAWERGLDLQAEALSRDRITPSGFDPVSILRPAIASGPERSPPAFNPQEQTSFMMSASGRGRGGRGMDPLLEKGAPANSNDGVLMVDFTRTTVAANRLRPLPRGGVMVQTSQGWLQLGVPMWTNKDAFEIFLQAGGGRLEREEVRQLLPSLYVFDLDYVARHDGFLPADFMQYMYFVNRGMETTLLAPDAASARRLREFLDLSFLGPKEADLTEQVQREYARGAIALPRLGEELHRGFPAANPETLRRIEHLNESGEFAWGEVLLRKLGPSRYEILDGGEALGTVDMASFPLPRPTVEPAKLSPEVRDARRRVLRDGHPAIWPLGTGHGFTPREDTSGFMIWNRGKTVLVDPPSNTLDYFRAHRLPLEAIDGILLTHGHTDHYGNAVPQLRAARPRLKIHTTPTIFRMLQQQYSLALGDLGGEWNFSPLYPQAFAKILGLHIRPEYSFHPVPTIGFEIYDRPDVQRGKMLVSFTGDTFADHVDIWAHTKAVAPATPLLSVPRAHQILRHEALLLASKGQRPAPIFLIEGGVPPIHTPPARTRELLDRAGELGIDTSRVFVYHVGAEAAAAARVPKWVAGVEGFLDLSEYFRKPKR